MARRNSREDLESLYPITKANRHAFFFDGLVNYLRTFQFSTDNKHSLLFYGAGNGLGLIEDLSPKFSTEFTRIIGIDLSPTSVEEAIVQHKDDYPSAHFDKLYYHDKTEYDDAYGSVIAIWSLRWKHNTSITFIHLKRCFGNNGYALYAFERSIDMMTILASMEIIDRWGTFLKDVVIMVSPLHPCRRQHPKQMQTLLNNLMVSEFILIKNRLSPQNKKTLRGYFEVIFDFSLYIPPESLDEFYETIFEEMSRISAFTIFGPSRRATVEVMVGLHYVETQDEIKHERK